MKTLIIYNKETGAILFTQQGGDNIENGGITNITVEVPEDKIIKSVNVETNEVVLEDKPKTDIELLQEELAENTKNMAEKDLAIEQLQKDIADLTKQIATGGNE